jgi:hypothetical protein
VFQGAHEMTVDLNNTFVAGFCTTVKRVSYGKGCTAIITTDNSRYLFYMRDSLNDNMKPGPETILRGDSICKYEKKDTIYVYRKQTMKKIKVSYGIEK